MNKKLLVVVLLVVLVLTFASCDNSAHYKKLNKMGDDYKMMKIDVTVTKDGEQTSLTSNFLFERNVNGDISALYVLREYQQFDVSDNQITLPSGQISTKSGSCQIVNGAVTNVQGDQISLDLAKVSKLSVRFDDGCLTNVFVNDDVLTASVTDIQAFLGSEIDCSNVKVTANVQKLDGFILTYVANGCKVTLSYVITK